MRASRLLSILLMLQTRGRLTAESLAETFEVSVRTVYRDIEQLSAGGVPVYADRGPGGGFQLLDGFRTKLTGLTENEAETLFLSGLPGPATQLGLADQLLSAQLKLSAALPERSRASAQKMAQRFHLDPVGWFRSSDQARLLPTLAHAVWTETVVEIGYRRSQSMVTRRIHPLGLVLKAGTWYVVAERSGERRTYRVSNIESLTPSGDRFTRPKDFDLVRFWTDSSRAFEVGLYRDQAVLRASPRAMMRLERLGATVMEAARESADSPDSDGWVRITIPIESIDQAAIDLLMLGTEAEVLKPRELRRRIATAARGMATLNE
ncbi:MAG: YafY family transcriptional regulator [Proteobacteria bacterium]|nr:YafY family transcriptional regulator [Pseudomonadota bacterium]